MEKKTGHWGIGVLGLEMRARMSKMCRGGVGAQNGHLGVEKQVDGRCWGENADQGVESRGRVWGLETAVWVLKNMGGAGGVVVAGAVTWQVVLQRGGLE
jgi:hypothetical protein